MLVDVDIKRTPEDMPIEAKMCASVRTDNPEDEFLAARLLFLTTYGTTLDLNSLIEKHDLPGVLTKNLERHATALTAPEPIPENSMPEMAMAETLKLLFNVTHFCKDKISSFTGAIQPIITMLFNVRINPGKPLEPRVSCIVNALLNLDLSAEEARSAVYPTEEPMALAQRLIDILGLASKAYRDDELESVAALVGVIRAVHGYAPEDVRQSIREKLLPTEADRNEVLGRSGTLTSWLLKNSINPATPQLREAILDLFFEMSDKDPSKFVDNVGYGFASGFLANRNLSVPENAMGATAGGSDHSRPVNPVTGQFLDRERHPDVPEMSEEEKEREAERLFVLFERYVMFACFCPYGILTYPRLRKNGVISAENPVRTAQQSGRFEELPDDYEDELD